MNKTVSARSLVFVDNGERPAISFVLDSGEHYFVQITGHQIVLLNEDLAKYQAKVFREKPFE